jgi:hypothetical protein
LVFGTIRHLDEGSLTLRLFFEMLPEHLKLLLVDLQRVFVHVEVHGLTAS